MGATCAVNSGPTIPPTLINSTFLQPAFRCCEKEKKYILTYRVLEHAPLFASMHDQGM